MSWNFRLNLLLESRSDDVFQRIGILTSLKLLWLKVLNYDKSKNGGKKILQIWNISSGFSLQASPAPRPSIYSHVTAAEEQIEVLYTVHI